MSQDHPVARAEDIPIGEGRAHAVAGQQIAVFRLRDGRTRAVQATCPHAGGPLADGLIDDNGTVIVSVPEP
jgi:nitrite reductase (NADH) small subunit